MINQQLHIPSLVLEILAVHAKFQKIIPGFTITIFKTVMKLMSTRVFNNVGKKTEVIAECKQGVLMNPYPFFRIKVSKDPSVFP